MPTYQYRCTECGHDLEAVQKFTDASLTECPNCRGQLRKIFNAVGVVFKGSGFYRTDSREKVSENGSNGWAKAESGSKESAGGESNGKGSGSSESGGDSGGKHSGGKDAGGKETGGKETGGRPAGGSAPAKAGNGSGSGSGGSSTSGKQPVGSGSSSTG